MATTIHDILTEFRTKSFTQHDKGTLFEQLIASWLRTDPRYADTLTEVWLWHEFPYRSQFGGHDTGIDLVAKTDMGDYWAIQCKCYAADTTISKPAVDSFLATSGRSFIDDLHQEVRFAQRLWISTTNLWGPNAEEAIRHQTPPVARIGLSELDNSPVDWDALRRGRRGKDALQPGKTLRKDQLDAITRAEQHYANHDRGKMIMACGTGKTFTSLKLVERMLPEGGLVLFLVPSIALLGQSLNAWMADSARPIKAVAICSDARASDLSKDNEDNLSASAVDLPRSASTNTSTILRQLEAYRHHPGLTVVFSTYQSIDVVIAAQQQLLRRTQGTYGVFDFILCDEAHRTTGAKFADQDESYFTKVHSDDNVRARKRLYMTATPRIYSDNAKFRAGKAKDEIHKEVILCSMDDETIYGKEFHRLSFSQAVQQGILTDYKVLVITMPESDLPQGLQGEVAKEQATPTTLSDTTRLVGVLSGLSKLVLHDNNRTWETDPKYMHRAMIFAPRIGDLLTSGSSKHTAQALPTISRWYEQNPPADPLRRERMLTVEAKHVDGSMGAMARNAVLQWLSRDEPEQPKLCKVVTNVRCLSEGVDVPALDAVVFLSPRKSQVEVVQSVGRVMRSFGKGTAEEKKYGYIILPVLVPEDKSPEEVLNDNKSFEVVWQILQALRAHDDHFNAHVNTINLNAGDSPQVTLGGAGLGDTGLQSVGTDALPSDLVHRPLQLTIEFQDEIKKQFYARVVEKCGQRSYWENWGDRVGEIAKQYIDRVGRLVRTANGYIPAFEDFVRTLRHDLNPSVSYDQCIEMLAQHLITRPVFEALFADYRFADNNSISGSMQTMVDYLQSMAADREIDELQAFYNEVKLTVANLDNLEAKQTAIKNLYEQFFRRAFHTTVEQLGVVYTPVECVDFIIRSVDDILRRDFGKGLTEKDVHIIDPFTGTGTFITRLLQSGLITPDDLRRKYEHEIHCNEIVLLAYYIADVNIEHVYQQLAQDNAYLPFSGICLTDTFQLGETGDHRSASLHQAYFAENSSAVEQQKQTPIQVIIGNPPYSVGQGSANDNAQNLHYPNLEKQIEKKYVKKSAAALSKSVYDSYIKAFRWATDRLDKENGGVIAFITNGGWLDSNSFDRFRESLTEEFDKIYVLNLRGNGRISGEASRIAGGLIFDGSRCAITITFLVALPSENAFTPRRGEIYYHDIGTYLTRKQKLDILRQTDRIDNFEWERITPNEKNDWINQRGGVYDTLIPITPEKKFDTNAHSVFMANAIGVATNRDPWAYNFSKDALTENMSGMIDFYNRQVDVVHIARQQDPKAVVKNIVSRSESHIAWTVNLFNAADKEDKFTFAPDAFVDASYRPFTCMPLYYHRPFIERPGIFDKLFPTPTSENLLICVHARSGSKDFSCLITDKIPDLHYTGDTQCYPLYWYSELSERERKQDLFAGTSDALRQERYTRHDGVSDWILREVRTRFSGARAITKEDIFYYVYGILHSPDYRRQFANELRKDLPRIPIVDRVDDFIAFMRAGRDLAHLHLHYEDFADQAATHGVQVLGDRPAYGHADDYDYFRVEKMRSKKGARHTIVYNEHLTITGIPDTAYDYIVNAKSALDWLMERYQVKTDKASQLLSDPNAWAREHRRPRYILDLVLSVIHVSVETERIVASLPALHIPNPS